MTCAVAMVTTPDVCKFWKLPVTAPTVCEAVRVTVDRAAAVREVDAVIEAALTPACANMLPDTVNEAADMGPATVSEVPVRPIAV